MKNTPAKRPIANRPRVDKKIDLALTRAERLITGDPRPSIEERYPVHGKYVSAVAHSANRLFEQRLLLEKDRRAYIDAAAQSGIGK